MQLIANRNKSFSLVETIVVIGTLSLMLPAVFTIIFAIFRQHAKIVALREMKRQGDQIIDQLEILVRSSDRICSDDQCTTPVTCVNQPTILVNTTDESSADNKKTFNRLPESVPTTLKYDSDIDPEGKKAWGLYLYSGSTPTTLHNSNITLPNVSIYCYNAGSPTPLVVIDFTVSYNTSSTRAEEIGTMNYHTAVRLRNIQ